MTIIAALKKGDREFKKLGKTKMTKKNPTHHQEMPDIYYSPDFLTWIQKHPRPDVIRRIQSKAINAVGNFWDDVDAFASTQRGAFPGIKNSEILKLYDINLNSAYEIPHSGGGVEIKIDRATAGPFIQARRALHKKYPGGDYTDFSLKDLDPRPKPTKPTKPSRRRGRGGGPVRRLSGEEASKYLVRKGKTKRPVENPVDTGKWLGERLEWISERVGYYGAAPGDAGLPLIFEGKEVTFYHPPDSWQDARKNKYWAAREKAGKEYYASISRASKEYNQAFKRLVFQKSGRLQAPFEEGLDEPNEAFFDYLVGTKGDSKYSLLKIIDGMIAAQKEAKHRERKSQLGKHTFLVKEYEPRDRTQRRQKAGGSFMGKVLREHRVVAGSQKEAVEKVARRERIGKMSHWGVRFDDRSKSYLERDLLPIPLEPLAETKRHPRWVRMFSWQTRYSANTVKILRTYRRLLTSARGGAIPKIPRDSTGVFSAMKIALDRKKTHARVPYPLEGTTSIGLVQSLLSIFSSIGVGRGSGKIGSGFRQSEMSKNAIRLEVKPLEDYAFGYLKTLSKMSKAPSIRKKRHAIAASNPKKKPTKKKPAKKKAARKKTPPYQLLINRCQKLWTHYCERPSKKRLEAVYSHLDKMKESMSKKVAAERTRCLRSANAEAKKLKYKRK